MADNTRFVARVPIVPDSFDNTNVHKNHELVIDYNNNDLYVKNGDEYINITEKIKEDVEHSISESSVIHIVTENDVPDIEDRSENHWYYIITKSKERNGNIINIENYIYYGLINTHSPNSNYILIAQNMITGSDLVKVEVVDGYCPCFYIPTDCTASFIDQATGEIIEYTIEDTIYAMNNNGVNGSYDVYLLKAYNSKEYDIQVNITKSNNNIRIKFDTNISSIEGLSLPSSINISSGNSVGNVQDPTWENPRYIFEGYSDNRYAKNIINTSMFKPTHNITLYAWFNYEDDPSLLTYYSNFNSSSES